MATFTLPHPQINRLPTQEVDAEPKLWNDGYAQIDANFAAIKRTLDELDAEIRAARGSDSDATARIARIQREFDDLKGRIGSTVVNTVNGKSGNVYITAADVPDLLSNSNPYMTGVPQLVGIRDWDNEVDTEVDSSSNYAALASQGFLKRMLLKLSNRFVRTYEVGNQVFLVIGIKGARVAFGFGKATLVGHNGVQAWDIGPGLSEMYNVYGPTWSYCMMTPQVGSEAKFLGVETNANTMRARWVDAPNSAAKTASWMVFGVCAR